MSRLGKNACGQQGWLSVAVSSEVDQQKGLDRHWPSMQKTLCFQRRPTVFSMTPSTTEMSPRTEHDVRVVRKEQGDGQCHRGSNLPEVMASTEGAKIAVTKSLVPSLEVLTLVNSHRLGPQFASHHS